MSDLSHLCGASLPRGIAIGDALIGPCVLRVRHDGPVHKAADGSTWGEVELHPFRQREDVSVRVCVCGKWPAHHVHIGEWAACGCDECQATRKPVTEETHADRAARLADLAATEAERAARYATLATRWIAALIVVQLVSVALIILSIVGRHRGW